MRGIVNMWRNIMSAQAQRVSSDGDNALPMNREERRIAAKLRWREETVLTP